MRFYPGAALSVLLLPSLLLPGLACEAPVDILDGRVEVPPVPEGGAQFISPEIMVAPSSEQQWCWTVDWPFDEPRMVSRFLGIQSGQGHHLAAFKTLIPRQAGEVFDCTALESMTTLQPFLVPANAPGELTPRPELALFPEQFAVTVQPSDVLVLQSHYINASDRPMVVADVANLELVDPADEDTYEEVGYFVVNHGGIDIPEGDHEIQVTCEVEREIQLLSLFGHMHDWGTSIRIDLQAGDARLETLYEIDDWTVEFRDLAPVNQYTPEQPRVLNIGDEVTVTCGYHNDTGAPLRFPTEMCVGFGAFFGDVDESFVLCE